MIFTTTYQPGGMHRAVDGWEKDTIISLSTIITLNRENAEWHTPDALIQHIRVSNLQMVNFSMAGFPRHPVAINHPKLEAHIRKYFCVVERMQKAQVKHQAKKTEAQQQ